MDGNNEKKWRSGKWWGVLMGKGRAGEWEELWELKAVGGGVETRKW